MTVKPLDWITWQKARCRMPEIWDGWRYRLAHADEAMVNSLRRGNVPYRGGAYEPGSWRTKPIALRDVVVGLLALRNPRFATSFAEEAEYEAAEWGSVLSLGGYRTQPITVKKTAAIVNVELAWDEFRYDLIRYELPVGVKPARKRGPEPQKLRRYEAADRELFPVIRRLMQADQLSAFAAALRLASGEIPRKTVAGYGSVDSRAKRLATLYLQAQRLTAREN
jgi:hypothetical protein